MENEGESGREMDRVQGERERERRERKREGRTIFSVHCVTPLANPHIPYAFLRARLDITQPSIVLVVRRGVGVCVRGDINCYLHVVMSPSQLAGRRSAEEPSRNALIIAHAAN